ncbi:MAG: nitrous oxide reductase accessory protein NosL [Thaumarchaeota archaeon]|nr:nitrous oxide reductase accessory protein NosL [Candidatus Calditenuaceae archaeon]MDW8186515.1 nitrous oxide reductase accessory protein NosL [Nitrososphaerota archaeon]
MNPVNPGRRRVLIAASSAAIALGAAFIVGRELLEPSESQLRIGSDRCEYCGMVINDSRFSALMLADGRWRKFDDIGCMLTYLLVGTGKVEGEGVLKGLRLNRIEVVYVYDLETREQISSTGAWYVIGAPIRTPMLSGLIAFKDISKASDFALKRGGKVVSWEALLEEHLSKLKGEAVSSGMGRHDHASHAEDLHYLHRELVTIEGRKLTLGEVLARGKPVIMLFFATWCPTCSTNVRNLAQVYPKYKGAITVLVKSFDPGDIEQDIAHFKTRHSLPDDWTFILTNLQFMQDLRVVSQETIFGFDVKGRMVYEKRFGVFPPQDLESAVKKIIEESHG